MIKSNNIKRYAKSKLYSDKDWNVVRDSALEYINNHQLTNIYFYN